jgi:hypothetical protein
MTVIVTKCPKCGGQIKLREQWEEGFCIYCGSKVKNDLAVIKYDDSHCETNDDTVDTLLNRLCEKLSAENIRGCLDIQRVKTSVQSHFTDYGNRIRRSKNKYAKKMNDYCHRVGTLTYETTKNNWEELKDAVSEMNEGCALCMAYDEFSDAFLKSVEKLSSVLSLKWETSRFKRRNAPNVDMKELSEMRSRTDAVKAWLKRRQEEGQNALSTSMPDSNRN